MFWENGGKVGCRRISFLLKLTRQNISQSKNKSVDIKMANFVFSYLWHFFTRPASREIAKYLRLWWATYIDMFSSNSVPVSDTGESNKFVFLYLHFFSSNFKLKSSDVIANSRRDYDLLHKQYLTQKTLHIKH